MSLDLQIFYFFNNFAGQHWLFDALVVFFAAYLEYVLILGLLALVYFSEYSRREKIYFFFVPCAAAVAARFGITSLIRFFYHHPRPFDMHPVHQLIPENGYSFPSGHVMFFFAFSYVVYLYNRTWGIFFFIMSFLMGIARIIAGVHYPFDIAGGMLLGIVVGWLVDYCAKHIWKFRVIH